MMLEPFRFLFSENIIIYLQGFGNPLIDGLFVAITDAGSQPAYFLLASLIFWCASKKTGIRLLYVILFSAFLSIVAKNLLGMPRPPESLHKISANGPGIPSGHAQVSASFWAYLGGRFKNHWIILVGATAVLLISLSRVYLGVHYAGDVAGGIIFGVSIALVSLKTESINVNILQRLSSSSKYFVAVMLPVGLMAISTLQSGLLDDQIEIGLIMVSIGVGYLIEEERIRFEDIKDNKQKIKRALAGISLLVIIYLISRLLILISPSLIFFQYIAMGLTTTFLAPMAFSSIEMRRPKITRGFSPVENTGKKT